MNIGDIIDSGNGAIMWIWIYTLVKIIIPKRYEYILLLYNNERGNRKYDKIKVWAWKQVSSILGKT